MGGADSASHFLLTVFLFLNLRSLIGWYGFENLGGVPLGADVVPDLLDRSVGVDQKGATHNSQKRFPQKHLHAARPVGFDGLKFRVAQKREIQLLLGLELGLRFDGIGTTAKNDGSQFVKF
jgi:hypothetical protein